MSTEKEPNTFVERDRDYADWNRVRSAIEHENMLVNHRLTWFGTLQAFLFTAFGVVLTVYVSETKGAYLFLVFVIGFLGMFISFFIRVTLKQAQTQLTSLDCWWHSDDRSKLADKNQWRELIKNGYLSEELRVKKLPKHPPLQIYTSTWPKWVTDWVHDYNIPDLFIVAWIFILIGVWLWIA